MFCRVLEALACAVAGFALALIGMTVDAQGVYVCWPFTGVLAALLVVVPSNRVFPMIAAAFAGRWAASLIADPAAAPVFLALDFLELLLWTVGLRWSWRGLDTCDRPQEIVLRAAILMAGAVPSAVGFAVMTQAEAGGSLLDHSMNWWGADVLGGMVGVPLVFAWARAWRTGLGLTARGARLEVAAAACVAVLAFVSLAWNPALHLTSRYVMFAVLTWAALRFTPAIVITFSVVGAAAALQIHLDGTFGTGELLATRLFVGITSLSSLILAELAQQQRRTAAELFESERGLRALAERAEAVREEERVRISREVHDVMGQSLTAIKLELMTIPSATPVMPLVDETLERARRFAADLRSPTLDHFGLIAAIDEHAAQLAARSGLQVRTSIGALNTAVTGALAVAVFRATQEALTNVVRHARAARVSIDVFEDASALAIEIADDGVGMPAEGPPRSALGIVGMRERLRPFGGWVAFTGREGGGTVVTISVPVNESTVAEAA